MSKNSEHNGEHPNNGNEDVSGVSSRENSDGEAGNLLEKRRKERSMRELSKQLEDQRERLTKVAEQEFDTSGTLHGLKVREELDRFYQIADEFEERSRKESDNE